MKEINQYVLIVGSSNMDLNIYLDRLPKQGETVTGGIFQQFLGGKGANQAVASVRAGATTTFIGKIGMDAFGDQMIESLTKEGINTNKMLRDPQEASGIAFIVIDKNGENMISVAPGANAQLSPEDIRLNEGIIRNATAIVVQMEIPIDTISEIFKIASEGTAIKILNPAPLKKIPHEIFKNIDIIIPNEGELNELHWLLGYNEVENIEGRDRIIEVSKDIARFGVKTVITTLGSKGCLVYESEKEKITEIPAFKVEAIDTVGAGDCFNGVLASKMAQGKEIIEAVKYATAAASIAVTRKGAQASMPNAIEIEERYKEFE